MNLRPGDILLETRHGFFGRALDFVVPPTKSNSYQHAAAVWHEPTKVIEDWMFGVAVAPQHIDPQYLEVWRPRCDQATSQRALNRMALRLGEPYGVESLVAEGAWLEWGVNLPHGVGMFCSRLVCWGYAPEFDLVPGVAPQMTPPWMLRNPDRLERIQ